LAKNWILEKNWARMSELAVLYSFRRCPYAMRARMAIAVSGVEVEHREIMLRDKPAKMLAASPKGTVPVLVLPDGAVIDESLDIMRWALSQNDPDGWLDRADNGLIAENDGPFKAALDRYKYPHRYGLDDGLEYRGLGRAFLNALTDRLKEAQYLCGAQAGFTDIAIFPFIRQFSATDAGWFDAQPLPALQRWLTAMISLPLFADIMLKRPVWRGEMVY
jgi:glutathione S-transferase